ncbi:HK97 gp10 family phage protein [Deinococcus ficus]|uniref:HK97 gp10 family phage protein n=1 Tax=Deinococcus ficus TaxID=317577 RepID=UPI000A00A355|nr:HK97 gp10 family phage protein [Deinococcus ficus]
MFDPKVKQAILDAVQKAVEETAVKVQEQAREIVPKDTQHLMNNILVEKVGEYEVRVTANTDYAAAVHEGHVTKSGSFVQGTPYLLKPLQDEKENLEKRVKDNL